MGRLAVLLDRYLSDAEQVAGAAVLGPEGHVLAHIGTGIDGVQPLLAQQRAMQEVDVDLAGRRRFGVIESTGQQVHLIPVAELLLVLVMAQLDRPPVTLGESHQYIQDFAERLQALKKAIASEDDETPSGALVH
jgi:hypothetical protein